MLASTLMSFGLRQVIGEGADHVLGYVQSRLQDPSQALPRALSQAHDQAWQALELALGGNGLRQRIAAYITTTGAVRSWAEQLRQFLQSGCANLPCPSEEFRRLCLQELHQARKAGALLASPGEMMELNQRANDFRRYTQPQQLIDDAWQVVHTLADGLAGQYPNLAELLRQRSVSAPPLLVSAFSYFLQHEIAHNPELHRHLMGDALQHLYASQQQNFAALQQALSGQVLDLREELQRLKGLQLGGTEQVQAMLHDVLARLERLDMQQTAIQPHYSCSIRSEQERQAVRALLKRYRELPEDQRAQVPALLYGLGMLQVGAGDFAGARQSFTTVAEDVETASAQAEAHYNAYRTALEQQQWDDALQALLRATESDRAAFEPFPLKRYHPVRLLGAGGFGAVFLCQDRFFNNREVAIKTLHASELERGMAEVFGEAHVLRECRHEAIIGVLDCSYADLDQCQRPYIVMEYFPGGSLETFIRQRGVLSERDLIRLARQIAAGMCQAHAQGILHRDLKPDNILVRKHRDRWQVKIIDFGLALRRETVETSLAVSASAKTMLGDSVAGTWRYAPPEQKGELPGIKPGFYSDVYAFARLCFQARFGTTEPTLSHWKELDEGLAELLDQCLKHNPHERPANFEPVLAVLDAFVLGSPVGNGSAPQVVLPVPQVMCQSQQMSPHIASQPAAEKGAGLLTQGQRVQEGMEQAKEEYRTLVQRGKYYQALRCLHGVPESQREPALYDQLRAHALGEARRWIQTQGDYVAAVTLLEQVPAELRDATFARELLEHRRQRDEVARLDQEIRQARAQGEETGLWKKVRTLSQLQPSREDLAQLLRDLPREHNPGDVGRLALKDGTQMWFAWIPPGTFLMGSLSEWGDEDEYPQHRVRLTRGYWLGVTPVTQAQWQAAMGTNPSDFQGADRPVENISWEDCQQLCDALHQQTGKRFRLPTEAEWEHACRAGTTTEFSNGNDETALQRMAWYRDNAADQTHAVAQKEANVWNLHDMHGNVWEWCQDWCGPYPEKYVEDPEGAKKGDTRVLRGGSWLNSPEACRSASRCWSEPANRSHAVGCRLVLCLD